MTASNVDITVVVCTYNRADLLGESLLSLSSLESAGQFTFEVLVVDNGSTDHTQEVTKRLANEYSVPFRSVVEHEPGVAIARNRGVIESRGDWIAFFDDDQIADTRWLLNLWETARSNSARYVFGARRLMLSDAELEALPKVCRLALGELDEGPATFRFQGVVTGTTGNLLTHKSVFGDVGMFNESTSEGGEDADLNRRVTAAGVEAWYTPNAIVFHAVPAYRTTPAYFQWTSLRYGVHVARREKTTWGPAGFPIVVIARLAQTVTVHLPHLAWAHITGNEAGRLSARCGLWRIEGFFRSILHDLAPTFFGQRKFFDFLEFRGERHVFDVGEQPHPGDP